MGVELVLSHHGKSTNGGRLMKRVLRRTFGLKKKEVVGRWRTRHNEELHNLYTSPNIIRAT
jgi:hypothetical protein